MAKDRKSEKHSDADEKLARTSVWIRDIVERATRVRSKDREFHGLDRELGYFQEAMLAEFRRSRDVRHPRDVGAIRENILRTFLNESGLLPRRYAVSECSTRVASTSGHVSKEMDIALYDKDNAITLMRRADDYEVLPVESVFGVIQVKSKLGKRELRDALDNLASYKRLRRHSERPVFVGQPKEPKGFALLFAYEASMSWADVATEMETFAEEHPNDEWTNAVFILDSGNLMYGSETLASGHNRHIATFANPVVHGRPDLQGDCLYAFQSTLLGLLSETRIDPVPFDAYHSLPLVTEKHSYSFRLGPFVEYGTCTKHGDFQRKIPSDKLDAVIAWCKEREPKTTTELLAEAGQVTGNPARDRVWVYNPLGHPLKDILFSQEPDASGVAGYLTYDTIDVPGERMCIWLPLYYVATEQIITGCAQCENTPKRRTRKKRLP